MKQDKYSPVNLICYACGCIPVIWIALLFAPYLDDGLIGLIKNAGAAFTNPLHIVLCRDSLRTVLIFLLIYGLALAVFLSNDRNYRRREEHGSAQWGSPEEISRKYANKSAPENKILTQTVAIGLDGRKHRRNLNILCCGGSGAGKTRFFAKPNVMNANTSFVCLDPKGELLRDTGNLLKSKGYEIKVIDLINMEKSHCYNPFVYLRNDNDIQRLVTNLFKNTTPKGSQSQDPFWDQAAQMLLPRVRGRRRKRIVLPHRRKRVRPHPSRAKDKFGAAAPAVQRDRRAVQPHLCAARPHHDDLRLQPPVRRGRKIAQHQRMEGGGGRLFEEK